jgi:hypothetical protein
MPNMREVGGATVPLGKCRQPLGFTAVARGYSPIACQLVPGLPGLPPPMTLVPFISQI